jgi:hypothetical protein
MTKQSQKKEWIKLIESNVGCSIQSLGKPKLEVLGDPYIDHIGLQNGNTKAVKSAGFLLDTIHTGDVVTPELAALFEEENLLKHYLIEKDHFADKLCADVASKCGISWYEVKVARVEQDIGRKSGDTKEGVGHLDRRSTNKPYTALGRKEKRIAIKKYDLTSTSMERICMNAKCRIGFHSCDRWDAQRYIRHGQEKKYERPEIMFLYSIQDTMNRDLAPLQQLPFLPLDIASHTVDGRLIGLLSNKLSGLGFRIGHNNPYMLFSGAVELRLCAWWFAQIMKEYFESIYPSDACELPYDRNNPGENEHFQIAWEVIHDTNLRSYISHTWRDLLMGNMNIRDFGQSPALEDKVIESYEKIETFYIENVSILKELFWKKKYGTMAFEIRKDIASDSSKRQKIATKVAEAICEFSQLI